MAIQLDSITPSVTLPTDRIAKWPSDSTVPGDMEVGTVGSVTGGDKDPSEDLNSAILYHDNCLGDNETLADAGTRTVTPGPGTATAEVNGSSLVRYERGELLISNIAGTGSQFSGIQTSGHTVAAGLTVMVRIIPCFKAGGETMTTYFGFSTGTAAVFTRGAIQITQTNGDEFPTLNISRLDTDSDATVLQAGKGLFAEGQEIGLAVKYVSTSHQQFYFQGGILETIAPLGSSSWIMIGETTAATLSGTVYGLVGTQFGGTARVRDLQVLSDWNPSVRHDSLDYNRTDLGTHIPTLGRDPVTGLVVNAWNRGLTHSGQGVSSINYSVRLDSGWTDSSELIAAPAGIEGQHICSLSEVGGLLYLVYYRNADGAVEGGTLYWRTVTVNPTTGVVTLGTETLLNVDGTTNLAFAPIITLASGRLILVFHRNDFRTYSTYSDDGGSTWSTAAQVSADTVRIEPTYFIESDGAVGVYMRSNTSGAEYARCADPDAVTLSWSATTTIESIPQPDVNGTRLNAIVRENGDALLVGNDDVDARRNITIWRLGDNGAVLDKTPVYDWNPPESTAALLQYPVILDDGDDIILSVSRQPSSASQGVAIQNDTIRWTQPVAVEAGGTGKKYVETFRKRRSIPDGIVIPFSTAPIPDMGHSSLHAITLTASTATIGAPINALPWQELTLVFRQGGAGSFTASFNAIFEFGNITPTWLTAVDATNVLRAVFNELTNKWVVTSFT